MKIQSLLRKGRTKLNKKKAKVIEKTKTKK